MTIQPIGSASVALYITPADLKEHGLKGDPGEAATIQVGTVTASDPGSNPQVTNSGTEQDAVFNFVLPRGEQGPTGPAGPTQVTFGARSSFPETGQENMLYVDNTVNPALAYIWNGSAYIPAGGGGEIAAADVTYSNESSGLTAQTVQAAIDENAEAISALNSRIGALDEKLGVYNSRIGALDEKLGVYAVSKYVSATSFTFKSWFDDFTHTGTRQTVLMFGMINNIPANGMLTIRGSGSCEWTGTPENITASIASDGRVTVNLQSMAYDTFTMISGDLIEV